MPRDLTKVIKHVDQLVLAAIKSDYTPDVVTLDQFPFLDLGAIHDESPSIKMPVVGTKLIDGSTYQKGTDVSVRVDGMEISADFITILEKLEKQDLLAFQFYGPEPQFVMPLSFNLEYQSDLSAKGKRLIGAIGNKTLTTLASSGAGNPGWGAGNYDQAVDANSEIRRYATLSKGIYKPGLRLWCDPRFGNYGQTVNLFDASLKRYKGTLNSDHATIWQTGTPERFLRFDGVNDECNFGDILDDDGVSDLLIEVWLRPQAADGTSFPVICKKNAFNGAAAGFSIFRFSNNAVFFQLDSGAGSVNISVNGATQNLWKHFAVSIDRNGLGTPYLNAANGAAASVAAIGNAQNALSMFFGRDGSGARGQFDIGAVRFYNFGAGGLPSSIAQIIKNNFELEKSAYGL